ncbi:MAG: ABC transporter permease subunit [Armatimonadota bacterium]|nr:ABC transporter permease [bacterium]
MTKIWTIAKMSLLENSRKQVFHVLCLLMLTVIAGSVLLSIFTDGTKLKILKDLCMTCILFGGAVLAIALGSTGIPNDVEQRTLYPIIARPVGRAQYVVGKFLGTLLTVSMGVLVMATVFGVLVYSFQHGFDKFLPLATLFALMEVAVIAALATAISTIATPAVSAVVTFLVYICGTIKIGYFGGLIEQATSGAAKAVYSVVYHALPNLECFNLKTALVHSDKVPIAYLVQVALYGLCYAAFVLFLGSLNFARKEV